MTKDEVRNAFTELIERYNHTLRGQNHDNISEETIRAWLNELLEIFGWDVQDPRQIRQEQLLYGIHNQRLQDINSTHRKPDYELLNGVNIKTFLDAKSLEVNIFTDSNAAFQIRSYGWSAQVPCAFVSNFEQFVIYDTRFIPELGQAANIGTIQLTIDDYIDEFNVLYDHLWHDNICTNYLDELYAVTAREGNEQVDIQFMNIISLFRRKLANNIYHNNPEMGLNNDRLNYYVQIILDRIVFVRVCESKEIEEQGKLQQMAQSEEGFWCSFKNSCYMEFYNHYDGAMFERNHEFQQLELNEEDLVDFISKLYYPYPYKFDVIPIKAIANIYEEFLGKQLAIDNNEIIEIVKDEYVRTNGAVATPEHIVEMVCKQTVRIEGISTIEELLNVSILDLCCGSGVFIVSCYEHLADKMLAILSIDDREKNSHRDYYYECNEELYLTVHARREIVLHCLFAIDCDEAAIEVTKMSLALKIVDGDNLIAWEGIGIFGEKILHDIDKNIKLGNTLVSTDAEFSPEQILKIKPIDIKDTFQEVFERRNGFSYIVGNPPYVETKHYKAAYPEMHNYLKNSYHVFEGKADLSVLFIERGLQLLEPTGEMGFIIQRRWFKTEYGEKTRELISNGKHLKTLIDFKTTDIFRGRIVYASIMVLSKMQCDEFNYYYMKSSADDIKLCFENSDTRGDFEGCVFQSIPCQNDTGTWSFENYKIVEIRNRLNNLWGPISEYPELSIKDGIQALWKKIYHITNVQFENDIAIGKNGFMEDVRVESAILRGVVYNKIFFPFKTIEPDAYCIFPYNGNSNDVITFSELHRLYPLTFSYLLENKERIKSHVKCREGEKWHTFTREHNQSMYDTNKIIIPMTAKDTIATYVSNRGLYMDNANVWFLSVDNADDLIMKAITCIINSTIFSVLGKVGANPQSGGYYKFNKQFISPIPFPSDKVICEEGDVNRLSSLYDEISELQQQYLMGSPVTREMIAQSLIQRWDELDDICYTLYEVSEEEREIIKDEGRTVSRIDLLKNID